MSSFRWTSDHDVFLPEVDAEHRAIFLAANQLEQALQSGAPEEKLRESVHHLVQMAESHLKHEERLMRDSDFVSYDWHCKQHEALRARAKVLTTAGPEEWQPALDYMATWLKDHTAVADRIMASHVRNWMRRKAA